MKFKILSILLLLLLAGCPTYYTPRDRSSDINITRLQDGTVFLENKYAVSTGIVVYQDKDFSYVLTCRHCILDDDGNEICGISVLPTEHNGQETTNETAYPGTVVAVSDSRLDIAIIRLEHKFRSIIDIKRCSLPNIGSPSYVSSCPYGLNTTFTNGIIASYSFGNPSKIRSTAFIDSGSSGGGLYNADGQLIGMCQQIQYSHTGIGLFISINDVIEWLKTTDYNFIVK
jgi:S1-C subfamily serine protease